MKEDLTGQIFNHLTVLRKSEKTNKKHETFWECQCDCENKTIVHVRGTELKRGTTKSCGCLRRKRASEHATQLNQTSPAKKPFNKHKITGDTVEIYFENNDKICYIDLEDLEKVSQFYWWVDIKGYVAATTEKYTTTRMHNFLMGKWVDHIDRNQLNNRKSNLRKCTPSQNMMNRTKAEQTTSKYKGVHLNPKLNKWAVEVKCEGKRINLGLFENEEEAARAYDAKALELFGEFAAINFPEEHPEANPVSTLDTQAKNN